LKISKQAVVKAFCQMEEQELGKLFKQLQTGVETADGMGTADEAEEIRRRIKSGKKCLAMMSGIAKNRARSATPGSLTILEDKGGKKTIVLIVDKKHIGSCSCSALSVICTSIEAPLIRAILNRKKGEKVSFCDHAYTIVDVQ